jgi:hypothetical protein
MPHSQANEAVQAEVGRLTSEPSPLDAARTRLVERTADSDKFKQLIDNLQVGNAQRSACMGLMVWSSTFTLTAQARQ